MARHFSQLLLTLLSGMGDAPGIEPPRKAGISAGLAGGGGLGRAEQGDSTPVWLEHMERGALVLSE
jgi:hypothetical protein